MKKVFNSNSIINIILLWTLFVSILRSIRMPNDFAEAHWLLDYRFGFIKRGMAGAVYSLIRKILGLDVSPETILILSILVFAVFVSAIIYILFRIIFFHNHDDGIILMCLVFVSSPYIIMNSHLFGYLDHITITCTIVSISLILSNRFFFAAIVSSLAILVHENYLIIGIPVIFLASLLKLKKTSSNQEKILNIVAFFVPIVVFFLIFIFLSQYSDNSVLRKEIMSYLGSFDFISSRARLVSIWETTDFIIFFNDQSHYFFNRLFNVRILITFVPSLFLILFSIHYNYRIFPLSLVSVLILLAILSPLSMHLFAFDSTRISIYTIGSALIVHWIFAENIQIHKKNTYFSLISILILINNIFSHTKLMDKCTDGFSILERLFLYSPSLIFAFYLLIKQIRDDNKT